ncbi:MAG TPA: zinc-ribbon domain containing protein [Candidatus Dormibacteraeota bacterium]|jgi:CxxC-x17-CxxC domain-containing protein|nr:zinc-ribbon domain containing protein [Candidatus Dormibacteraeota bacterium]
MAFQDQTLRCRDCSADFVWTAGEQAFFQEKGLLNQPQRCPTCRANKRNSRGASRRMFEVVCAECGTTTQVPFEPRESRPVYCSDCFEKVRAQA